MAGGLFRYLSHPQVEIDPLLPVPEWGLSDIGRQRVISICRSPLLMATHLLVSSGERKALETARLIGEPLGLTPTVMADSHENDRSATGFLPPQEFEVVATHFFANPTLSVRGWERAIDAQARIVAAAKRSLPNAEAGDVLMVGHGGVGTLLYCHFAALPISRTYDQQAGGGNFWSMEIESGKVLHGWRPMEDLAA